MVDNTGLARKAFQIRGGETFSCRHQHGIKHVGSELLSKSSASPDGMIASSLWIATGLTPRTSRAVRQTGPRPFRRMKPASKNGPDTARINSEFQKHWQTKGLPHALRTSELAVVRRLSLALTGTIPSVEEIRALEQVDPEDRIPWWVAHLLEDRRYADYVAERLARAYVGTEDGPFILFRRRRFVTWLADHLHRNTRYDNIVTELISDTGLWNSSPAVNFVTVTAQQNQDNKPDEIRLAARTTRAFLGMRIDCLQCHDDKMEKVTIMEDGQPRGGTQQDFHHLAAFFGETG
jgi:hypothetical protein